MASLLEQAINCDDSHLAARIIQDALGIESDEVTNYCFPKTWPEDHEQRARIIGDWLRAEARFVA
jgi:uncharacterized protein HemY